MSIAIIIGAYTGFCISLGYYFGKKDFSKSANLRMFLSALFLGAILVLDIFLPQKAHAWCDNCRSIPWTHQDKMLEMYKEEGRESERLLLEIKALTDEYGYGGKDAFMTSIASGMSSLPACDIRVACVAVVLANSAIYFCKTVECHWKTVYLLDELEYHLYFFKQLGDEIVHNRWMCVDCHKIYFTIHYMGNSKLYFNHYPPCTWKREGCKCEGEEFDLSLTVKTNPPPMI